MKQPFILAVLAAAWFSLGAPLSRADTPVRVQGVGAVTRVMKNAAPQLQQLGIEIKIGEECGNAQAIAALGNNEIDVALLGRPLAAADRANYPEMPLEELKIGAQTLALLISRTVWESGVKALKREQVMELYEGKVETWKQFGGEDRSTRFFEPAHGHGIWEIFATWLYGDMRKAPAVRWEVVADGSEAQNAVAFRSGGIAVAPVRWADRREVFPLAIIDDSGAAIEATPANVAAGKYPLSRPAYIVVGNRPSGARRKILEFLRSEKGQAVVAASDLVPVSNLEEPK